MSALMRGSSSTTRINILPMLSTVPEESLNEAQQRPALMFSSGSRIENSALRYSLIGIEPKQADGRGSDRGKWLDSIAAQFEVILPAITAGVKQGHSFTGFGVDGAYIAAFP